MRPITCYKYFLLFYIVVNCLLALTIGVFSSFLLLSQYEIFIFEPKRVVIYFLIIPPVCTSLSTILGWSAIKKSSVQLVKFFALVLVVIALLELAGCLWWFSLLPQTSNHVLGKMKDIFTTEMIFNHNWWDDIQSKLKCCGIHGPLDYKLKKVTPFSCCGSNIEDHNQGFCTFLWQRGCSTTVAEQLIHNMNILCVCVIFIAFLQVPGVFISWWFANKLKNSQLKFTKTNEVSEQIHLAKKSVP